MTLSVTRTSKSCAPVALFLLLFSATSRATGVQAQPPPEVVIPRARVETPALTADEEKRINMAVERGVEFLRRTQLKTGTWIDGTIVTDPKAGTAVNPRVWAVGYAALPALALLEAGVPPGDPAIQQAAHYVRAHGPALMRTYEVSLALIFLDKVGAREDQALIRSLGLRLAGGQGPLGGWSYNCPVLTPAQEKKFAQELRGKTAKDLPQNLTPPPARVKAEKADNSNTQFAILALWVARKHDVPLDYTFSLVEQRFRQSESARGWSYNWTSGGNSGYGSMTCVGLLALAAGRGSAPAMPAGTKDVPKAEDEGLTVGLRALGLYLSDPTDTRWGGLGAVDTLGPKGTLNFYFLWSVERVGVLCNLKTIGGRDWYRWGVELLVPTQHKDGSWLGRGNVGSPVIDTSMALLFLKRSDLLPDLRETLQKRLTITDPGLEPKGPFQGAIDPKKTDKKDVKSPMQKKSDKLDLKNPIDKKSPGEKIDSPGTKETPLPEDAPLSANLGDVKAGQTTKLPVRVRGPAAFKITAIRGGDEQLRVEPPRGSRDVHELTIAIRPDKTGDFERTLHLVTDIPGRAEVPVEIRLRALAP